MKTIKVLENSMDSSTPRLKNSAKLPRLIGQYLKEQSKEDMNIMNLILAKIFHRIWIIVLDGLTELFQIIKWNLAMGLLRQVRHRRHRQVQKKNQLLRHRSRWENLYKFTASWEIKSAHQKASWSQKINSQGPRNRWSKWSNCFTGIQRFYYREIFSILNIWRGKFFVLHRKKARSAAPVQEF